MQRIIPLVKNGCCIFIGAGIPKLIGFPTWKEMVGELLEYTWINRDTFVNRRFTLSEKKELESMMSKEQFIQVLTFCQDIFKANNKIDEYYKKLEELFTGKTKYKNIENNGYAELLKLGERSFFVQTNVDLSLEVYIKRFKNISVFINMSLPPINSIPVLSIIYLHGVITCRESLVFTIDEYNAFYQKNNKFITFIQQLFDRYDVIFVGYGLNDKEILDNIVRSNSHKSRIIALGKTARDETRNKIFSQHLTHYGVEIVEYDIEAGHEKIIDFLKELNFKLTEPPSVALPSDEDRAKP